MVRSRLVVTKQTLNLADYEFDTTGLGHIAAGLAASVNAQSATTGFATPYSS